MKNAINDHQPIHTTPMDRPQRGALDAIIDDWFLAIEEGCTCCLKVMSLLHMVHVPT